MRHHLTVIVAIIGVLACGVGELQILALVNNRHHDALVREEDSKEQQHNAAINRAINVERWCEGKTPQSASLNGIVRFNKQFVRIVTHGKLNYALQPNDCELIVKETLDSSKRKSVVTKSAYPLVYEALHPPKGVPARK